MVNGKYLKRIVILVFVILGAVLIGMAAPGSVSNLQNVSYASTYINWTWVDPADAANFTNVTVYIDGAFKENTIKGKQYFNTTNNLSANTNYLISTRTQDANGSFSAWVNNSSRTAPSADSTPPASITNLINNSNASTYINWTWTDPADPDFDHVMIYINGTFITNVNKTLRLYKLTGLADTVYNISTHTVDTSGNTNFTWVNHSARTAPLDVTPPASITNLANTTSGSNYINWTWTDPADLDLGYVMVYIDGAFKENTTKGKQYYNATGLTSGIQYNISTQTVDVSGNINSTWVNHSARTKNPSPSINIITEPSGLTIPVGGSLFFNISVIQDVNVTWAVDSTSDPAIPVLSGGYSNYTFKPANKGKYNVSATATNSNDTVIKKWSITVTPTTFSTGNRIWDGSKPDDFALTYTWNPMSFSGFYYNAKDDVGNENISITVGSYSPSTISKGNLVYRTSPQEVSFASSKFGKYQVIGFMADNYFAGYTVNTTRTNTRPTTDFVGKSAVSQGQLHKVLIDEDVQQKISVGGTLALKEGYVLKATDIDLNARTMLLTLLKDGNEVDVTPLKADETYVYAKTVGGVDNLPLIMVRFDNVFSGQELQVAFMKGIFQISEDATLVKTGNKFRNMEVSTVSADSIEMKNSGDIGLTKGSVADIMGDVKLKVAKNDSVVRFALSVEKTGNFEVRSTVYKDGIPLEWTPYNFGMNIGKTSIGFYYDLDDGVGSEKLKLLSNVSGRSIPEKGLEYSTSPNEVKFTYTGFGKYQVIGFMADKYFAGYTSNTGVSSLGKIVTRPSTDFSGKSALANGALHKVLVDDDTQKVISVGSTIALQEGYVIKATDIDLNARQMLISLLKDGTEVDVSPLSAGETYVYTKDVGGTEALPLVMVRFENVFSGREIQSAFLKGIFQISENPTTIKVADQFGKMEVRSVSASSITMSNDGSIGLDKKKNEVLMGNLKLKVADNDALRFYFAVDVTAEMIANQLAISAPTKVMAGDTVNFKVTAGTVAVANSTLSLDTEMGTTDKNGELNYTIPKTLKAGTYIITATKTGYEKGIKNLEIEKYVDYRLSIEMPSKANQYETINIKVLYNGSAMSDASVLFDNTSIGTTNSNGEVNYRLETSGTHSITASKKSYITVSRDLDIRAPYSEFKALNINVSPNPVFAGDDFVVKSNITNVGTKSDTLPVDLFINGTVVDNRTITIGPNEKVEINFTRQEPLVTNVTVDIMGQNVLLEVQEKPTNYLLIAAIVTGIGAVIIYVLTSKGLLSLELLKQKFQLLSNKLSSLFKK